MNGIMVLNPGSGGARDPDAVDRLKALAAQRGIEVCPTVEPGDARRFARQAVERGTGLIIAAGGDGTISEVVNGMAGDFEAARLAVIPLGTANDLARTLGVPVGNVAAAMAVVDRGIEQRIDLIGAARCLGNRARAACATAAQDRAARIIINASTGGFSELVHDKLTDEMKQAWGLLAYLRAAMDALPEIAFHRVHLEIDEETHNLETCCIIVANGRSAGGMIIDPVAEIDDHRLDILIVTAKGFLEEMRLASHFLAGVHLESEHIIFRRARAISIESNPTMAFSSDGELVGETPLCFRVIPQALRMLVPEPPQAAGQVETHQQGQV